MGTLCQLILQAKLEITIPILHCSTICKFIPAFSKIFCRNPSGLNLRSFEQDASERKQNIYAVIGKKKKSTVFDMMTLQEKACLWI